MFAVNMKDHLAVKALRSMLRFSSNVVGIGVLKGLPDCIGNASFQKQRVSRVMLCPPYVCIGLFYLTAGTPFHPAAIYAAGNMLLMTDCILAEH